MTEAPSSDGTLVQPDALGTIVQLIENQTKALDRVAAALEKLADKPDEPTYGKKKPSENWSAVTEACVRLLDADPVLTWERAQPVPILKDKERGGNIYREIQWGRFVDQHLVPESLASRRVVGLDEPKRFGRAKNEYHQTAVARLDEWHCARSRALELGIVSKKRLAEIDSVCKALAYDSNGCRRCGKPQFFAWT